MGGVMDQQKDLYKSSKDIHFSDGHNQTVEEKKKGILSNKFSLLFNMPMRNDSLDDKTVFE
jgi:hypothetical protein